jgi:hypothetical protein
MAGYIYSLDAAPGAAPVRAPQDRAVVSHGHAGAGARAGHAIQVVGRAAGLATPDAAPMKPPRAGSSLPPTSGGFSTAWTPARQRMGVVRMARRRQS